VSVCSGRLHIDGNEIEDYEIVRELGRGANGVVFLANNLMLNREEALKIWLPLRVNDRRDKIKQGLEEAIKLAAVNGNNAVQIYHSMIMGDSIVATMEYIDGETLKQYFERAEDPSAMLHAALIYLNVIEKTTTPTTRHGDPHWKNVLVYEESVDKYEKRLRMKLCDFGTSLFAGVAASENRHWSIVRETVLKITEKLEFHEYGKTCLQEFDKTTVAMISMIEKNPTTFDPYEVARMRTAALHDYLDCLRLQFPPFRK